MSQLYKKISVVALSVVISVGSIAGTVEASHREPKIRSGIKGDVMGIVCKTSRSGRMKCKIDEVAATMVIRNAATGELVATYVTDDGGFKVPLPGGTYTVGIDTTTDPVSPRTVTVIDDKYTKVDFHIQSDINFQF